MRIKSTNIRPSLVENVANALGAMFEQKAKTTAWYEEGTRAGRYLGDLVALVANTALFFPEKRFCEFVLELDNGRSLSIRLNDSGESQMGSTTFYEIHEPGPYGECVITEDGHRFVPQA